MLQFGANLNLNPHWLIAVVFCALSLETPDNMLASVSGNARCADVIGDGDPIIVRVQRNEIVHLIHVSEDHAAAADILHLRELHCWLSQQLSPDRFLSLQSHSDGSVGID